jgi:pimeloyl-ACP methyl ester carboxylesterase
VTAPSQLSAHSAERVDLPGPYGPIAALRTEPADAVALLVPGYTGSKEDFAPLLDRIADAGFQALAIDLPGQYESPGPADEAAYEPSALGVVVAELAEKLSAEGQAVVLLGHSYGGLVVRRAVLAGAPVAGLTLMDTGPGQLTSGARLEALRVGEPLLRANGKAAAYRLREQLSARFPSWTALPAELKDFLRARFVGSSSAGLLGMAHGLRTEPDLVPELAAELRRRSLPALVVSGENDDAWSVPDQREMAERLTVPFHLIPGAAHSPNMENPDALLAFLLPTWRRWLP